MFIHLAKSKKIVVLILIAFLLSLVTTTVFKNNKVKSATTSFRFVVMGDSRGAADGISENRLRSLLTNVQGLALQPEFLFFTGDQVQGGTNVATELTLWKDIVDDYYPITKLFPALGNHEEDETIFSNKFSHLPQDQLPGYNRTAYYFDYGNARFIVLNSNREDANGDHVINLEQRTWLESTLQNTKTHNFVFLHMPPYPIGDHVGSSLDEKPAHRDALWNILDQYNVSAVFTGHEHNYNRRIVDSTFNGSGHTFQNSVQQITLGGAGAPLDSQAIDTRDVVAGPNAVYHYMIVDVADNQVTLKAKDIDNNLIETFTITR